MARPYVPCSVRRRIEVDLLDSIGDRFDEMHCELSSREVADLLHKWAEEKRQRAGKTSPWDHADDIRERYVKAVFWRALARKNSCAGIGSDYGVCRQTILRVVSKSCEVKCFSLKEIRIIRRRYRLYKRACYKFTKNCATTLMQEYRMNSETLRRVLANAGVEVLPPIASFLRSKP